jgi:hypothetical protein
MTGLFVTLLVRDEIDVIAANIEFHLAQGAERLIVTDNGSVDGTADVLEQYRRAGVVDVINEPTHDYSQSAWVTRMARLAFDTYDAAWIVNADADEFWVSHDRSRRLSDEFAGITSGFDTVTARRQDLRSRRRDVANWSKSLVWRDTETQWQDGRPLGPKSAHRGLPDVTVAQGNHAVTANRPLRTFPSEPIDILHVPLRGWPQFESKIRNGGSSYAANTQLGPEAGWHWRADYELLKAGTLHAAYQSRQLGMGDVAAGLRSGRIVRDVWLRDYLRALLPSAVLPEMLRASLES